MRAFDCPRRLLTGVLALWSACADPSPPPLRFVANEELGSFRLVDVTPRTVALSGGPVTLSWEGVPADAGSYFYLVVGEALSPTYQNLVGPISPSPDGGAVTQRLSLPGRTAGTHDLSLVLPRVVEYSEFGGGRVGALVGAVTYRSTPGAPRLTPLAAGPTNLRVPLRASLAAPCARSQEFSLTNLGDEVLPQLGVSVTGDGFSTPSTCPPTLDPLASCALKVCFEASTPGVYRGTLRATSGKVSEVVELSATVLEPSSAFAWQRRGQGLFAVSGSVAAIFFEGATALTLIDDRAVREVPLGAGERIVSLVGDGAGSFGAFVVAGSQPHRLTSFTATGTRGPTVAVEADKLFDLGRGRVATLRGRWFTAWSLPGVTVDTSWANAGAFYLPYGYLTSVASTADGRLFLANADELPELSPGGQLVTTHQHPARFVAANDGTVVVATPSVVLRWTSNAWGFVTMTPPGLVDLAIDPRQRILLSLSTGTTERRRADTSVETTLPVGVVECSGVVCLGAGVDGPDPFIARLAD